VPDTVPPQLVYEIERRFNKAKRDIDIADSVFIESQTDSAIDAVAVHDPYNLAHHVSVFDPGSWAHGELEDLPEPMIAGVRSVRFDKKEHARTWTYEGETKTAGATYDPAKREILIYVNPNRQQELIDGGLASNEAMSQVYMETGEGFLHEAMHHVHMWRATCSSLIRFLERARKDGDHHVNEYVSEAYAPETGLNGDMERFAETGMMFYRHALSYAETPHHFEAFQAFTIEQGLTSTIVQEAAPVFEPDDAVE